MSDFFASVSQHLLNAASKSLFPSIRSKLQGSSSYENITASWSITDAPTFDLSQPQDGRTFQIGLSVHIEAGSDKAPVPTTGICALSISGDGNLSVELNDLTFNTDDKFLSAVLSAKKQDIIGTVDQVLDLIKVPIGPIAGVTFNGYSRGISNDAVNVMGSLGYPGASDAASVGTASDGFRIGMSRNLIYGAVKSLWWDTTDKTIRPNKDVVIHLNSFDVKVSGDSYSLTLDLSGDIYVDVWFAEAHWSISISTVTIGMNLSINDQNVMVTAGSVSKPDVTISPANALAWATTLPFGGASAIIELILSDVIAGKIPDAIRSAMNTPVFTVPTITETFQGISVNITPKDLSIGVMNDEILITGQADVT